MSLKTTVNNYKNAKRVYQEIDNKFYDLQSKNLQESEFILNQLLNKLNTLKRHIRGINISDLTGKYPDKTIDAVTYNIEVFNDAVYFWERFLLGSKYAIGLRDPIRLKYVPGLNLENYELNKWGGSENEVSKRVIGTLTHPDNVLEYDRSIKRMILGTMIQREFNRIFDVLKHKMHKKINEEMIEPINEDFFNPFDDDSRLKETKPQHISDKSSPLVIRKETFNLARVEYSKRPNGEYTVIAKTHFARGEIIEMCPAIILGEESKAINKIKDIIFEIDKDKNEWALVLGYGSLYKHNDKPNVEYAYNKLTKQMYFITKRTVKQGEELTINYGQDYWMERMNFNTMTDTERTDKNQGMPVVSGKVVTKNESGAEKNAADIQGNNEIKSLSAPNNPHNPVRSGVAIIGSGQS
jgi:hypothetical protein